MMKIGKKWLLAAVAAVALGLTASPALADTEVDLFQDNFQESTNDSGNISQFSDQRLGNLEARRSDRPGSLRLNAEQVNTQNAFGGSGRIDQLSLQSTGDATAESSSGSEGDDGSSEEDTGGTEVNLTQDNLQDAESSSGDVSQLSGQGLGDLRARGDQSRLSGLQTNTQFVTSESGDTEQVSEQVVGDVVVE